MTLNKLRVQEVLSELTPLQDELMDFFKIQPSHLGFLLSISKEEFESAYRKIEFDDQYLAIETALLLHLYDKHMFTDKEAQELTSIVEMNYAAVSLIRKRRIKYRIGETDSQWSFIPSDKRKKGSKLFGKKADRDDSPLTEKEKWAEKTLGKIAKIDE